MNFSFVDVQSTSIKEEEACSAACMIVHLLRSMTSNYADRQPRQLQLPYDVPRSFSLPELVHWEGASGGGIDHDSC